MQALERFNGSVYGWQRQSIINKCDSPCEPLFHRVFQCVGWFVRMNELMCR